MDEKTKVSALLIVKNERRNIVEALESLQGWVDEIVVVDDESTDNTRELASAFTDKVFVRRMRLEGEQRNFAAAQARNDWVVAIDADERVTPELQQEIDRTLSIHDGVTIAYWVPRKNFLGDYWLRHGGWYPAPHIKLYHRKYLKWREIPQDVVHPGVDISPGYRGAQLQAHLIHYNFKNIEDFIAKTNRQSTLEAIKWHLEGKRVSLLWGFWRSFDRFWRRYVSKTGYKDGYYGFVAAFLSGFYQLAAYSKYRELKERGCYLERLS